MYSSILAGAEFQYSSWINNANGPSADVNKIFRLCKKLPDKTDFFLKVRISLNNKLFTDDI